MSRLVHSDPQRRTTHAVDEGNVARHACSGVSCGSPSHPALKLKRAIDPAEPRAGAWKTWVLGSGKRRCELPPPPDAAATAAELRDLKTLAGQRDARTLERIRYWDYARPASVERDAHGHRCHERDAGRPGFRSFAMLNVALHDAMVAAWDSKYAHNRRRHRGGPQLVTAVAVAASPSYPCEHSVAAGAAAAVLAHLFPKEAARSRQPRRKRRAAACSRAPVSRATRGPG